MNSKKSLIHLYIKMIIKNIIEQNWFKDISSNLLDCESIFTWNAKSNLKHKWIGSVEYYHQDYIYWKGLGFNLAIC